eukprot:4079119-Pyramimonas_sp.AAC.1
MIRGGFLVVNLYLVHSVGVNEVNWDILCRVGRSIEAAGMAFVIGGDLDIHRTDLQQTGWVDAMDAVIVAPVGGTCRPAMRCIHFFVVSRVIAGAARAEM